MMEFWRLVCHNTQENEKITDYLTRQKINFRVDKFEITTIIGDIKFQPETKYIIDIDCSPSQALRIAKRFMQRLDYYNLNKY